MTGRDRLVVIGIAALVLLAGGWLLLVSPERQQAAQAQAQVESARQQLQSAQAEAANAHTAQARYTSAYTSVVSLGKAVPPLQEVPALIYELDQASNQRSIDFNSISSGSSGSTAGAAGPSASASSSAAASATAGAPTAFTQMPFTFIFKGSFFGLAHLLGQIDGFARTSTAASGSSAGASSASEASIVHVSGRLLTIQGVNLTLENQGSASSGGRSAGSSPSPTSTGTLTATITATAYVLPASQGLTGGASASGPAGAGASQPAASSAPASTPTSPAVIQGTP
jgi:type II secretory pathway pseudopilin PulG